ncbi:zinc-binding alcohol dehydrogenase family protein [Paenibacillus kobensis]|uniref:zinc-binding alcohol dehydrogenase family protein n=1 Tax=Paenibacillus kobensis TaxID=59841 RepID=UPI000FD7A52A|nr:zinc-binding alcohol dehydrogenase family protein [Paenibacillus kobensis]
MRGIQLSGINEWQLRDDLPEPVPGADEAVVRIRRVGICGTDMHAYRGNQPFFTYPRIIGHELSGIVEQAGSAVRHGIQTGDPVAVIPYLHCGECVACRSGKTNCCVSMRVLGVHADGGLCERIVVPATHLIKTDGLSFDQAAMLEPLAIGAHAVRRSRVMRGETVLVIGAGPIGLGVMASAKAAGANVIAMDVNEERLAFCQTWARADHTVHAFHDPHGHIKQITGGDYPTVVFDATGNAQSMEISFDYPASGGTLVFVGLVKSRISFDDAEFHRRELTVMGSRNATREDFDRVKEAMLAGIIDVGPYITHRASLDTMTGEFDRWLDPAAKVIKAIVEL